MRNTYRTISVPDHVTVAYGTTKIIMVIWNSCISSFRALWTHVVAFLSGNSKIELGSLTITLLQIYWSVHRWKYFKNFKNRLRFDKSFLFWTQCTVGLKGQTYAVMCLDVRTWRLSFCPVAHCLLLLLGWWAYWNAWRLKRTMKIALYIEYSLSRRHSILYESICVHYAKLATDDSHCRIVRKCQSLNVTILCINWFLPARR